MILHFCLWQAIPWATWPDTGETPCHRSVDGLFSITWWLLFLSLRPGNPTRRLRDRSGRSVCDHSTLRVTVHLIRQSFNPTIPLGFHSHFARWQSHPTLRRCEKIAGKTRASHPAKRDQVAKSARQTKGFFFASLCALASLREAVCSFTSSPQWVVQSQGWPEPRPRHGPANPNP